MSQCKSYYRFRISEKVRFTSHPSDTPDVTLSDFFLFDYLKHELSDCFFSSAEELLAEMSRLAEVIPFDTLVRVFAEWIEREHVTAANRDYFE
jgi:hypothetical protein